MKKKKTLSGIIIRHNLNSASGRKCQLQSSRSSKNGGGSEYKEQGNEKAINKTGQCNVLRER